MAILLSWKNPNTADVTIKIYRSTSAIDTANLPAALVTLPGDAKSYVDSTALGSVSYYYVVEATNGTTRIFAKSPSVINLKSRGPGPAMLQQGDYDCGYFGTISADQMPNIVNAFGYGTSAITIAGFLPTQFHKFAWKGRILYLAEFATSVSYLALSTRSNQLKYLRSGLKYNFISAELSAQVPNVVTKDGFSFHARSIRSTPENWDGVSNSIDLENLVNPDTEFNQLACSLMQSSPRVKRKLSGIRVVKPYVGYPVVIADPLNNKGTAVLGNGTYPPTRMGVLAPSTNHTGVVYSGPRQLGFETNQTLGYGVNAAQSDGYYNSSTAIWPVYELIEG